MLEVLEQPRIHVDCMAVTSIGALVVGAWAAARPPRQLREELVRADWDDMFQGHSDYADLNALSKRLSQRSSSGTKASMQDASAVAPPGGAGQQDQAVFLSGGAHRHCVSRRSISCLGP